MNRSLSNIEKLCEVCNHPEKGFRSIHVAGTNGKGSVSTKIASSLQKGGYKIGLYTSPHISSFRERIRIGEEIISEQELCSLFFEASKAAAACQIPATFFEIATLIAFLYFQRAQVDAAVIETGLGGRWDATNVITPLVSVITSIGYDHMEILGSSLEEIGNEKGGIIKKGVPVVLGQDVCYSQMKKKGEELGSEVFQTSLQSSDFDLENQETARLALSAIAPFFPLPFEAVEEGLKKTPPCRFEQRFFGKEVILDVAHNPHGFSRLLQKLADLYPGRNYRFVAGFSKGKDISECARLLVQTGSPIHLVQGEHPRLAKGDELEPIFRKWGGESIVLENTIEEGVRNALSPFNGEREIVVITGSFFIMSAARKAIGIEEDRDPMIWYDPLSILEGELSR